MADLERQSTAAVTTPLYDHEKFRTKDHSSNPLQFQVCTCIMYVRIYIYIYIYIYILYIYIYIYIYIYKEFCMGGSKQKTVLNIIFII